VQHRHDHSDDTRSDQEIVDEIAKAVGFGSGDKLKIETLIRPKICGIRLDKSKLPQSGQRKVNRAYAKKLRAWLDAGVELFSTAPSPYILALLFAAEPLKSLDTMIETASARKNTFDEFLTDLHKHCDWVEKSGVHENKGYLQERAAILSCKLMLECGLPLAWSSPTSQYRKVAGLFYEAATGEQGQDIERACEAIALFHRTWAARKHRQI
jgi:hypothetical protein